MSADENKTTDDGWLSIVLPLLVIVAVSLFTSIVYNKLKPTNSTGGSVDSQVLVLSMNDWISTIPDGADTAEIDAHMAGAQQAAKAAADQGYIVLLENSTYIFPDAARLKPGMFGTDTRDQQ